MYLINYHLYANAANMQRVMAEDTGAAELRNPSNYLQTEYQAKKPSRFGKRVKAPKFSETTVNVGRQNRRAVSSI